MSVSTLRERLSRALRDLERRFAEGGEAPARPRRRLPPGVARAYADLELTPEATLEEARAAWRKLVGKYHPDRFSGDAKRTAVATRVTAKLTAAWETVKAHLELEAR